MNLEHMAAHNDLGAKGEELAASFLEAKGYQILDRNYRFERAEIDLAVLCLDPAELIFVEVKSRSTGQWGNPELAVTDKKQQLIFKAADSYIYEKQLSTVPVRFDIVAITFEQPEHPLIHHIEDAFQQTKGGW